MSADLGKWLANVDPVALVPARRGDEGARIERPLVLDGSAWFDDRHAIAVVHDARGVRYGVPIVVDAMGPRRAVAGDGTAQALVAALGVRAPSPLSATVFHHAPADGESAIDVDQTNDLVVVGGQAVVKWNLHPGSAGQVGAERLAALAAAGFDGVPRTWAVVEIAVDGTRLPIATVGEHVAGASDGWEWAVDEVRALARAEQSDIAGAVVDVARLVARMHIALASSGTRPAEPDEVERWSQRADTLIANAALDDTVTADVRRLVTPLRSAIGTPVISIHGDLHVGQVLRSGDPYRYWVIDFDGSPTDDDATRDQPQPPARDVASMLASWDHVGRVVLRRTDDLDASAAQRVEEWIERSQVEFLAAYRDELDAAGTSDLLDAQLVTAFQALQECREYVYAQRYLPHWSYVPDAALPALIARHEELS